MTRSIPVVALVAPTAVDDLRQACEEVGFLSVVGHGVPEEVVERAFATARRFFALPVEQKGFATLDSGVLNRGYDGFGSQKLDPAATAGDLKEVWDIGLDLPWDHPLVVAGTPMHGPNPWPDDLPWFREPVEAFYAAARDLTERLLSMIAVGLGLAPDAFAGYHRTPIATMRLLHYPPATAKTVDDQVGAGAHTDWGAITVLAQDEVGGLQVRDPDSGAWLDVVSVPGAFVVNIGDLLARWTNDRFRSTMHRVVPPPRDRYSVVFFMDLDHHARIEVLPSCVPEGGAPRYEPTTAGEHLLMKFRESMPALEL